MISPSNLEFLNCFRFGHLQAVKSGNLEPIHWEGTVPICSVLKAVFDVMKCTGHHIHSCISPRPVFCDRMHSLYEEYYTNILPTIAPTAIFNICPRWAGFVRLVNVSLTTGSVLSGSWIHSMGGHIGLRVEFQCRL